MARLNEQNNSSKKKYQSPTLTVYGSVRELTGSNSGANSGDGGTMMAANSDPALKENIVRVGEHSAGFGLYLFDFKPEFIELGAGRQFGVMADEVEQVVPDAVVIGKNGYRAVNYAMLGITRH